MTAFPPLEALIPHRGRMLLVGGVLAHSPEETTCWLEVAVDSIVAGSDGRVGRWIALEYMAQTIAVHAGLSAWHRNESTRLGFLLGSRRVDLHSPLRVGQSLAATARYLWGQVGLGLFACTLRDRRTGAILGEGQLSVALADTAGRFGNGESR